MCTVSVISLDTTAAPHLAGGAGFRVVVNRDEQLDRPPALFPRWRAVGQGDTARRAIWPIDPKGGGTWVAAGDHALVLCLLNRNPEPMPALPPDLVSRGAIIPRLIACPDSAAVMHALESLELDRFAPFRLVVIEPDSRGRAWRGGMRVHEAEWDRVLLRTRTIRGGSACFVSSGLGDSKVVGRVPLFEDLVGVPTPDSQDAFHNHTWAGREHLSVMMSRDDARTVSVTTVEATPRHASPVVRMSYRPVYAARWDAVAASMG